ncbi:MAG: hypothetical protein FD165_1938 [Gammaproteobacteria bacterium]|nr:MAG: hypothetical protein FD165_1938 [Gammaproteobacteria bacterium]TND04510.1 MAG: hypothetical protein FD120_1624 [Gammaproteobacteria bacterium]
MSKAVFVTTRIGAPVKFGGRHITALSARLTPDNIKPVPPRVIEGDGILLGIINPTDSLRIQGCSVCMGTLFGHSPDWWRPESDAPDGSYALFRGAEKTVELLTDILASRTIWYVKTDDLFIAATSQRAIVYFLQSYQPNETAYPWMLSSGTLGPELSWDKRIRCLPGDARLILDRESWELKLDRAPVAFRADSSSQNEHEKRLRDSIQDTFDGLDLDFDRWVLPLSGGYDSRAILQMLKDRPGLKTVTWGVKAALSDENGDACVARDLASHYRVPHQYFYTDLSDENVEYLFTRFLVAGEGRIDHISGYMDGFAIWKALYERGYQGIIRGDEAFGCRAIRSDRQVYKNMGMQVLSDFENVGMLQKEFGAGVQVWPHNIERQPDESRETWRDRANTLFEFPFVFAALSDLKLSYVEISAPLLSRKIITQVRCMPDSLRTNKSAFKHMVTHNGPGIRYATGAAIESRDDILRSDTVASAIRNGLRQEHAGSKRIDVLSRFALELLAKESSLSGKLSSNKGERIIRRIRSMLSIRNQGLLLDPYLLAFRVYIIRRMHEILDGDASAFSRTALGDQ